MTENEIQKLLLLLIGYPLVYQKKIENQFKGAILNIIQSID